MAAVAAVIAQYTSPGSLEGDGFVEFAKALSEAVTKDMLEQAKEIRDEYDAQIAELQAQSTALPGIASGGAPANAVRDFLTKEYKIGSGNKHAGEFLSTESALKVYKR